MASPTNICNLALGFLGAERITSFENPKTDNEQTCQLFYPLVRDMMIEEYQWSFCVKRTTLTSELSTPPHWGYGKAFLSPPDAHRLITVRNNSSDGAASNFKWNLENDLIICNAEKIYVKYLSNDVPSAKYSPMFVIAFATKLAAYMCMQITENRSLKADLTVEAETMVLDAINSDNMQGTHESIHAKTLQNARNGG